MTIFLIGVTCHAEEMVRKLMSWPLLEHISLQGVGQGMSQTCLLWRQFQFWLRISYFGVDTAGLSTAFQKSLIKVN